MGSLLTLLWTIACACGIAGAQARYAGTWYDQDKYHLANQPQHGLSWTRNYYQDLNGSGLYDLGEPVSETFAQDLNDNRQVDAGENWGTWKADIDDSCWAATASNMIRTIGGGDYYHRWMYVDGMLSRDGSFTADWTRTGSIGTPLIRSGYRIVEASTGQDYAWTGSPVQECMDLLRQGLPLGMTVPGHAFSVVAITADTMTFGHSDADEDGLDYVTHSYTFENDRWRLDWDGNGNFDNLVGYTSFAAVKWTGAGTGGVTDEGIAQTSTRWEQAANWVGGQGPDASALAVVEFANGGLLHISSNVYAQKVTLLGQQTSAQLHAEGSLHLGALQVSESARLDAIDSRIFLDGDLISDGFVSLSNTTTTASGAARVGVNGSGSIDQGGGSLSTGEMLIGVWAEGNGHYTLSGGGQVTFQNAQVGVQGQGHFRQVSGTVSGSTMVLGAETGASGIVDVDGGTFGGGSITVGAAGEGTFRQSAGAVTVADALEVGHGASGTGSYQLSGGTLTANHIRLGYEGSGEFSQSGGSVDAAEVMIGERSSSVGTYTLSGNGSLSATIVNIGWAGRGQFVQSGGTVSVDQDLNLALGNPTATGAYEMSAGLLDVSAGRIVVGSGRRGTLWIGGGTAIADTLFLYYNDAHVGGTVGVGSAGVLRVNTIEHEEGESGSIELAGTLQLGYSGGSGSGSYVIPENKTLRADQSLVIGYDAAATVTATGYPSHVISQNLVLGDHATGRGTLDLLNCEVNAGTLTLGRAGYGRLRLASNYSEVECDTDVTLGSELGSTGVLEIVAGYFTAQTMNVGASGLGDVEQSAGLVTLGNLYLGSNAGGFGNYRIRDGHLSVAGGRIQLGQEGEGLFQLLGGEVVADELVFGNGASTFYSEGAGGSLKVRQITNRPDSFSVSGTLSMTTYYSSGEDAQLTVNAGQTVYAGVLYMDHAQVSVGDGGLLRAGYLQGYTNVSNNSLTIHSGGTVIAGELGLAQQDTFTGEADSILRVNSLSFAPAEFATGGHLQFGHAGGEGASAQTLAADRSLTVGGTLTIGYESDAVFSQEGNVQSLVTELGRGAAGAINQTGGTHVTNLLSLGVSAGHTGAYNYDGTTGALVMADQALVGSAAGAVGVFSQVEGLSQMMNSLVIGNESGSDGTFILDNGNVMAGTMTVGQSGVGRMEQTGGRVIVMNDLDIGNGAGSSGSFTTSGDAYVETMFLFVGGQGMGTFHQGGGTVQASMGMSVGSSAGTAVYQLTDGTLNTSTLSVGVDGAGRLALEGGVLSADELLMGSSGSLTSTAMSEIRVNKLTLSGTSFATNGAMEFGNGMGFSQGTTFTLAVSGSMTTGGALRVGHDAEAAFMQPGGTVQSLQTEVGYEAVGQYTQIAGTHNTGGLILGYHALGDGTYTLSGSGALNAASMMYVGHSGSGTFTQNGGTVTVGGWISLGQTTYGGGTYEMNAGLLQAWELDVGYGGGGEFRQVSGTVQLTGGNLNIGSLTNGHGSYTISGGILNAGGSRIEIGLEGIGSFALNGGVVIADEVRQGMHGSISSNGYSLLRVNRLTGFDSLATSGDIQIGHGGGSGSGQVTLAADKSLSISYLTVGYSASAEFSQTGGSNSMTSLHLGESAAVQGHYTITAGSLAAGSSIYSGYLGQGTLTQSGGTVTAANVLYLAYALGSSGRYELEGGSFSAPSQYVGYNGVGEFVHSGGTNQVTTLYVGRSAGGSGTYRLSGAGVLQVQMEEDIGYSSTGLFEQSGGTHSVTGALNVGVSKNKSGTFRLSGGSLNATGFYVGTQGLGQVQQSGGSAQAGTITLGVQATGAGSYDISGGSLNVGTLNVGRLGGGTLRITGAAAHITVSTKLSFGATAVFSAVAGSTIHMTGSQYTNESTDAGSLAGLANLTMVFEGGAGQIDFFEVAGRDLGLVPEGFDLNFTLGTLKLGGVDTGYVQLVNSFDNQPLWSGNEALYVNRLIVGNGSTLDLNGYHIYCYSYADLGGTVINGEVTALPEPATMVLFSTGLGVMGLLRRRRKA
ncbi:MAG: PEP-CTERM sorting domain-containing protein [Planctomycetaceae bacterium]|nr:PEP-CTERM sorting domain-containing protein [Planctomycetaceae bacterium]